MTPEGFERILLICLLVAASLSGKVGLKPATSSWQVTEVTIKCGRAARPGLKWLAIPVLNSCCPPLIKSRSTLAILDGLRSAASGYVFNSG